MSLDGLLDTPAEILRATPTVTGSGEVELAWSVVSETRCAVTGVRGRVVRTSAGEEFAGELVAYFAPGTDLRPDAPGRSPDRVRIQARDYTCVLADCTGPRAAPVRAVLCPVA